ncbi:MAG: hypothetical protein E7256_14495 [Lachnospiraceae bacterium]|nr:hypothetical protein [Lachnospiraceae bacterium]
MKKATKKNDLRLNFDSIFRGKKIPILTLDEKWLSIFTEDNRNAKIRSLQADLNALLMRQGRLSGDIKGYKRIKAQFMQDIVENMEVDQSFFGKLKAKKLEKSQKKILEINERLEKAEEEEKELPNEIKRVNEELLKESIQICYGRISENSRKINELDEEISEMRIRLKKMILDKQDMEEENTLMYTYMHDTLGHQSMETLDRQEFRYADTESKMI